MQCKLLICLLTGFLGFNLWTYGEKNLFPELEYMFKHALIQEVAYDSLLQRRREELHEDPDPVARQAG